MCPQEDLDSIKEVDISEIVVNETFCGLVSFWFCLVVCVVFLVA